MAKKPKKGKAARGRTKSKSAVPARRRATPRSRSKRTIPEQIQLPATNSIRSQVLDEACRLYSGGAQAIGEGKSDQASAKQAALKEMLKRGIHSYRAYGQVFSIVPGEDKLIVSKAKDDTPPARVDEDTAEGEDANLDAMDDADGDLEEANA